MKLKSILQGSLNLGAFLIIAYASYLLILLSLPFTALERDVDFLETKQLIYHIRPWRYSFYIHVFTSPIAIVAGLLQFNRWIIKHKPKIHKVTGYCYVIVVLFITGPTAFIMSLYANGGRPTQSSFVILSTLWILFTWISYRKIRKGDVLNHIKWNLRSYALTLSAISLRFIAYLLDVYNIHLEPKETYLVLAWSSWTINLVLVEIMILLKYPNYLMKHFKYLPPQHRNNSKGSELIDQI
ncbi:MAG: DUF2306 domain-containing protein [Crocinitomicaceae bacterium]|nr:DUF2306 domain-containing protein [Crocinitomicaceae bacterium]